MDIEKNALKESGNIVLSEEAFEMFDDYWINIASITYNREKKKAMLGNFLLKGVDIDNRDVMIVKDENGKVISEEKKNEWLPLNKLKFDKKGTASWNSEVYGRKTTAETKQVYDVSCYDIYKEKVVSKNYWIDMRDSVVVWDQEEANPIFNNVKYQKFKQTASKNDCIITLGDQLFILKNIRRYNKLFTMVHNGTEKELAETFIRISDVLIESNKLKSKENGEEVEIANVKKNAKFARIGSLKKKFKFISRIMIERSMPKTLSFKCLIVTSMRPKNNTRWLSETI